MSPAEAKAMKVGDRFEFSGSMWIVAKSWKEKSKIKARHQTWTPYADPAGFTLDELSRATLLPKDEPK